MRKTIVLLAAALLCAGLPALGDIGKTWTTSGAREFAEGKLEGVSVESTGEVELAPETQKLEGLEAEYVWDVETGPDGTAYVATGSPAAVYTVREGKVERLFSTEEKQVLSVLPLPDGTVLAGTAPQGIIFRIGRHGKATVFADLEDQYIWEMALGRHNEVYCATGPNGRLLELAPDGSAKELLKVKQKNFTCVAVGKDGTLYAGTDTDGYIYSIAPNGRASLLYDADETEVHQILVDGEGALYACTAQSEPSGPSSGPPSGPPRNAKPPSEPTSEPAGPPSVHGPGAYNSVYRIVPDKGAFLVARFDKMFMFSLAPVGDRLLVGTGTDGRVLSLRPEMQYTILTQFDAAFVWAMAPLPGGDVIAGTCHPGSLRLVKAGCRDTGTYVSKPFDASYLSRWGTVRWTQKTGAGQSIRVKLRSGNSAEPDERYSDWSEWVTDPAGQAVNVPMGRFAQFEAELSRRGRTDSPLLLNVDVSYRQANRRPVIEDVALDGTSLLGKEERGGRPSAERTPPRGGTQQAAAQKAPPSGPGAKTIAWKAADPNDDDLSFSLYYRGVHEAEWKKLKEDLRDDTSYAWDTVRVPDGYYLLRLIASDIPSRTKEDALAEEKVAGPFLVDNTPPTVVDLLSVRRPDGSYELTGIARDTLSSIAKIEVSHNGEDWRTVFPTDGILDSPREPFSYAAEALPPGEHVFTFAAADSSGNIGNAEVVVTVQPAGK